MNLKLFRKKWFHPHELQEQFQLDMPGAGQTAQISQMNPAQRHVRPDTGRA
ncbi:hypothetical protein N6H14_09865 [Paenibacillus sp. CC-CFT747]|nr:hypothetical protein N6H14_09865 [Paenibacillus sp. CC-CFT747]